MEARGVLSTRAPENLQYQRQTPEGARKPNKFLKRKFSIGKLHTCTVQTTHSHKGFERFKNFLGWWVKVLSARN